MCNDRWWQCVDDIFNWLIKLEWIILTEPFSDRARAVWGHFVASHILNRAGGRREIYRFVSNLVQRIIFEERDNVGQWVVLNSLQDQSRDGEGRLRSGLLIRSVVRCLSVCLSVCKSIVCMFVVSDKVEQVEEEDGPGWWVA